MIVSQNPHFENTRFTLQEIAEVLKHHADDQLTNDVISDLQAKRSRRKRAISQAQIRHIEARRKEVERLWQEYGYSHEAISETLTNNGYIGASVRNVKRDCKLLGLYVKK